jgi:hypothetical protein
MQNIDGKLGIMKLAIAAEATSKYTDFVATSAG